MNSIEGTCINYNASRQRTFQLQVLMYRIYMSFLRISHLESKSIKLCHSINDLFLLNSTYEKERRWRTHEFHCKAIHIVWRHKKQTSWLGTASRCCVLNADFCRMIFIADSIIRIPHVAPGRTQIWNFIQDITIEILIFWIVLRTFKFNYFKKCSNKMLLSYVLIMYSN